MDLITLTTNLNPRMSVWVVVIAITTHWPFALEEISAQILRKMKDITEAFLTPPDEPTAVNPYWPTSTTSHSHTRQEITGLQHMPIVKEVDNRND